MAGDRFLTHREAQIIRWQYLTDIAEIGGVAAAIPARRRGIDGHSHGLGAKYVLHEQHGMAKARHALETLNYKVEKVSLLQSSKALAGCA